MSTFELVVVIIVSLTLWTIGFTGLVEDFLCGRVRGPLAFCALTPKVLQTISNMNEFGCWCTAIFIRLINPVWSIVYFVYYIFHIGMEDKK